MVTLNSRKRDAITFLVIEVIFGLLWTIMYSQQLFDNLLIGGDIGIYNINGPIVSQFMVSQMNLPNIFASVVYTFFPSILVVSWDFLFFISSFSMPVGIYILLNRLNFRRITQVAGSIFYSLNPLSILMGIDWEYSVLLFFVPILFLFLLKFYESKKIKDMIYVDVVIFLLFAIQGLDYFKFIIFILVAIILLSVIEANWKKTLKNTAIVGAALTVLLIMLIPAVISTLEAFLIFKSSASSSSAVTSALYSIAQFEYSASSVQGTIFALPYVSSQLTSIAYESSWFGLLYLSLIVFSIIFAISSHNRYRRVNLTLVALLFLLLIFQYGVYNGSLLYLFHISYVDIYNYPLFFYFTQMFIYAFFFSQLLESSFDKLISHRSFSGRKRFSHFAVIAFTVVVIALVLLSSMPVMQYEIQSNPVGVKAGAPSYVTDLTLSLKPYQGERIMVLPENTTSLSYVYVGAPQTDVYGFPYGYQNFAKEFPNPYGFENMSGYFVNSDIPALSLELLEHDIQVIVILNPGSVAPITSEGVQLDGGGAIFANEINATGLYKIETRNQYFIIYTLMTSSINTPYSNVNLFVNNLTFARVTPVNDLAIVTSNYSYSEIPISISLPAGVMPDSSGIYDQLIFAPLSLSGSINANFSNIMFRYTNGTCIPAWIENITSNGAYIYLKLDGEFNRTIDVMIFPENSTIPFSSGYLGEAPQISGTGTTVLPNGIKYSSVAVGAYGYGYEGSNYTLNFTFNPSQFSNLENRNLSNLGFYTYSGSLLSAQIHGTPTNTSTSTVVSISFPGGVHYFLMQHRNYNIFYIGFAKKDVNLSSLHSHVTYTPQPDLAVGYVPFAVRNFGFYDLHDNGKNVFPEYNAYINGYASANGWGFGVPVPGYGLLSFAYYPPDFTYVNNLGTIRSGMLAETLSYIGGQEASPLYISNQSTSAFFGNIPVSYVNFKPANQLNSTEIGWISNTTSERAMIAENFNNSTSFVYKNIMNVNLTQKVNLYGIFLNGDNAEFILNSNKISNFIVHSEYKYISLSNVWGGSIVSYYSLIVASPEGNIMPFVSYGNMSVYQAYFHDSPIDNPVYQNETAVVTAYPFLGSGDNGITWKVNGIVFDGNSISISFNALGNHTIYLSYLNKTFTYNISVLPVPSQGIYLSNVSFPAPGTYAIPVSMGSGNESIIKTYVNGIIENSSSGKLAYHYRFAGRYIVLVRVYNSAGFYQYTINVCIGNAAHYTIVDWMYLLYNVLFTVGAILFMLVPAVRSSAYRVTSKFLRIIRLMHNS